MSMPKRRKTTKTESNKKKWEKLLSGIDCCGPRVVEALSIVSPEECNVSGNEFSRCFKLVMCFIL